MAQFSDVELQWLTATLDTESQTQQDAGSNDFFVPDSPANRQLLTEVLRWKYASGQAINSRQGALSLEEAINDLPIDSGELFIFDFWLTDYLHWRLESQTESAAPLSATELVHIEQTLRTILQQEDIDERECWLIGNAENRAFAQAVVERTGTDYVANEAKELAISEAALVQFLCERCIEQANLAE